MRLFGLKPKFHLAMFAAASITWQLILNGDACLLPNSVTTRWGLSKLSKARCCRFLADSKNLKAWVTCQAPTRCLSRTEVTDRCGSFRGRTTQQAAGSISVVIRI